MAVIDNLVSYWSMDEASGNALDAHGSNDLTDNNTVGAAAGKVSGARDLEIDNSEHFSHVDNTELAVGDIDFSFSVWVNAESLLSFPVIFSKGPTSNRAYALYWDGTTPNWNVQNNGTNVTVAWGSALSINTWYHIAVGHNATSDDIWITVDAGTPVTQPMSGGADATTDDFLVGLSVDQSLFWDGLIDELGFWKRDIRNDVSWLYNSGSGRSYADIVAESGSPLTSADNQKLALLGWGMPWDLAIPVKDV